MKNTLRKICQYNNKIYLRINDVTGYLWDKDVKEINDLINLQFLEITRLVQKLDKMETLLETIKGGD